MLSNTLATVQQPAPTGNGPVILDEAVSQVAKIRDALQYSPIRHAALDMIREGLEARAEVGVARYGMLLRAENGRNPLVDWYQELLDSYMYGTQVKMEGKMLNEELEKCLSMLLYVTENVAAVLRRQEREPHGN